MTSLIDTSLWIDFTRARSPRHLKQFIAPYILHPDAQLGEPVIFEILRHATPDESRPLKQQFSTFPVLATPPGLWRQAAEMGQACRQQGFTAASMDLLISSLALHHDAEIVTFDGDFIPIGKITGTRVKLLQRPA